MSWLGSPSFHVAAAAGGEREVHFSALLGATDAMALSSALAWLRARDYLAPEIQTADQVLALRALVGLLDQVDAVADAPPGAPVTWTQSQVLLLAEAAARYVADRDTDDYLELRERERLARARVLADGLFDVSAQFAEAVAEAEARPPAYGA